MPGDFEENERPRNILPASFGPSGMARTDRVAVLIDRFRVWPSGCTFALTLALHPDLVTTAMSSHDVGSGVRFMWSSEDEGRYAVLVEVQLADGQYRSSDPRTPNAQRLVSLGGGGYNEWWEARYWLSPLPAEPDMKVSVTWPIGNVSEAIWLPTRELYEAAQNSISLC